MAKQRVLGLVPVLGWLPSYDKTWLKFDLIAGLTLAAFAIPDNMAYATLAGLPPEYGLYAGIMAPLAYFIFATSRHASVGPSSPEAIMVATFLAAMVISSPAEYAGIVALTAILVGIISVVAWLLKLGFLVNLISGPVMKGFLVGTGIVILVSQIPKLLGLEGAPSSFFQKIVFILQNLPETNLYAASLAGMGCGSTPPAATASGVRYDSASSTSFILVIKSRAICSTLIVNSFSFLKLSTWVLSRFVTLQ